MNKIIVLAYIFIINTCAFGKSEIIIRANKNQVFQLKIENKKYYLIPAEESIKKEAAMNIMPDRKNPIACNGTLLCYKCCTAHASVKKDFCEYQYKNWKRGVECGCEDS